MSAYFQFLQDLRERADPRDQEAVAELVRETLQFHEHDTRVQCARYEGIEGTRVGMTLFYTDLLAKLWQSTDFGHFAPIASVPGFLPAPHIDLPVAFADELARNPGTRIWFGPRAGAVSRLENGTQSAFLFDHLFTRIFAAGSNPAHPGAETRPREDSRRALGWWNRHFDEVADHEQEYHRQNQIMKWALVTAALSSGPLAARLRELPVARDLTFLEWHQSQRDSLRFAESLPEVTEGIAGKECIPLLASYSFTSHGNDAMYITGGVATVGTYVFRIARRHIDVVILPIGRVHLRMDLREVVDDRDQLGWLAAHLGVADAMGRFAGVRRLVIVPHDAVANVPFAALPVAGGALCEQVAIAHLDRLSRLQRFRRRTRVGRFVTVGLASYAGSGQDDLHATEIEAGAVVEALGARCADAYVGERATCGQVRAALPGATHAHVSAHGLFDPAQPARSGVLLRDGAGHGVLTLHELRRLDLRRMQLATLATCRSAASARLPGRERICLPSALLDAGARGVIASLWPVEDRPSLEVMTALYGALRRASPAAALARTQASLREAGCSARDWAGLVFYGNE